MQANEPETYDVVGVGFGPSNLALAVAVEEHPCNEHERPLTATFLERKPALAWHPGMLLPTVKMQVSFLKDLATFRNPTSRYGFVSYVHQSGRLADFVNKQDFFPTRQEFHDYLEWAGAQFAHKVSYGAEVVSMQLPAQPGSTGPAEQMRIEVRHADGRTRLLNARNVVLSTGLVPKMPAGIERGRHVWHSSEFLDRFQSWDGPSPTRVAVVGAGQSAAEIVRFVYDALPEATVSAIIPSYGYSIADDTPFANRIFDANAVDDYFYGTQRAKDAIWRYHKNTNYGVVDSEVIRYLHRRVYDDNIKGLERLDFVVLSRVEGVRRIGDNTRLLVHSALTDHTRELDVDVVIFASGYDAMEPSKLLGDLEPYCLRDENGRLRIERDYRIATTPDLECGIYLQGGVEHTHGLSSSLLSNIAVRSGEIVDSIDGRRRAWASRRAAASYNFGSS